jgi:riboflavin-specific deaminase-like protein
MTPSRSASIRNRRLLPFVSINMAMTADGKIASANRAIRSFSSRRDQEHLLELRTGADAVMCGARTLDSDKVNLSPGGPKYRRMRIRRGLAEYNLRIIVSGTGTIDPHAAIFKDRSSPIILFTTRRAPKRRLAALQRLVDEIHICGDERIDFVRSLAWLRKRWKVRRLLCEGGGELNAALFAAGLVNELNLTVCPKVFGGRAAPTIADGFIGSSLAAATRLRLKSIKRRGDELFLVFAS